MRFSFLLTLLAAPCLAVAAPKKPKAAVPAKPAVAVPAQPAVPTGGAKPAGTLIDSDMNGRELTFLTGALDLGRTYRFLADQAARTANPDLRGFGEDLVKTLAAQSAVLTTVAEMRNIKLSEDQAATGGALAERFAKLDGARLEKALLDAFRETDRRAIAIYEIGVKSADQTIHKLSEQTLPQIREHLLVVEAMTGIAPKRTAGAPAAPVRTPAPPVATPAPATVATVPVEKVAPVVKPAPAVEPAPAPSSKLPPTTAPEPAPVVATEPPVEKPAAKPTPGGLRPLQPPPVPIAKRTPAPTPAIQPIAEKPAEPAPAATPALRPGFRTNVRLPSEAAPATGR
jgi:hypothetical protein